MKIEFSKWANGSAMRILGVFLDLLSDPSDVRIRKISAGRQGRVQDIERTGDDIRKAASVLLSERGAKHGTNLSLKR